VVENSHSERPTLGRPLSVGITIIALFFGAFIGWAALVPLESAAIAPGEVSVETRRKTVQHFEGGIVGALLVRDGDQVEAGQIVIRLDATQSRANLGLLRGRFRVAKALEARLTAERDRLDEIPFAKELLAQQEESEVAATLAAQRRIFAARADALRGQSNILRQRIAQYRTEIEGLEGDIAAQDEHLRLSEEEVDAFRSLIEKGMSGRSRMLELQREAAEVKGERSRNIAAIARVHQRINETTLEINELATARMNEVLQELRDAQAEIYDLEEKILAAEDILRRTEIRAPLAGTIVGLQVHTVGGVVAPGEALMDIVPRDERLIIEARLNPADIDVVTPGLDVRVRFTALSQRNHIPAEGKVVAVSADRLVDERTGETYYNARVELGEDLSQALQGKALYPGMQTEVMIVTGSRVALDYLLQPLTQSFNRAFREG